MKTLLTIISTVLVQTAFACPDFSGTYICGKNSDGSARTLVIKQDGISFVIATPLGSSEIKFIADGHKHEAHLEDYYFLSLATCDPLKNQVSIRSIIKKYSAKVTSDNFMVYEKQGHLLNQSTISNFSADGLNSYSKIDLSCTQN